MSEFQLHPQLAADTHGVCSLATCDVLLMNDSRYPWLILVPRIDGAQELYLLAEDQRQAIHNETNHCTEILAAVANPYKMNVATLGNQVEQLHIHIIARFTEDPAWPAPVWGHSPAVPYSADALNPFIERLAGLLVR